MYLYRHYVDRTYCCQYNIKPLNRKKKFLVTPQRTGEKKTGEQIFSQSTFHNPYFFFFNIRLLDSFIQNDCLEEKVVVLFNIFSIYCKSLCICLFDENRNFSFNLFNACFFYDLLCVVLYCFFFYHQFWYAYVLLRMHHYLNKTNKVRWRIFPFLEALLFRLPNVTLDHFLRFILFIKD